MNKLEQVKAMRNDFMQGNGKGGSKDVLARQKPGSRSDLTSEDITNLYAKNRMVQNIIDIPAEDMTRAWFTLRMKDKNLQRDIMSKLADLKAREMFMKMRQFERLRGDGFISIGTRESKPVNLAAPLDETLLKKVEYIHAFSGTKVKNFITNEDMFSPRFGQVEKYGIKRRNNSKIYVPNEETIVDASRIIHDQTRKLEDEQRGQSLIEPIYDAITVLDTALWSVGQILYDFTFKVYQSDGIEDLTQSEKQELSMLTDFMFRTEALAIIGLNESLNKTSTNTSGIEELLSFVWDYVAGVTRMPKTVIKGQEAGTIAGAQYDVMNYYSRIAAYQENEMKPLLERLIRLLLWSEDELGGRIDPESLEWEIAFNPLWAVDSKTDAEIRKLNAETDAIYLLNGVHTADDIRASRFGQFGLAEELSFSGDSVDLERMAKEVHSAWKERGSDG